jgi:hypothetical protein
MALRARSRPSAPISAFEHHEEAFFAEGHRLAEEQKVEDFRDLDRGSPRRGFFRRLFDALSGGRRSTA